MAADRPPRADRKDGAAEQGPTGPATGPATELAELAQGDALPGLQVTPDRYLTVRYAGASGDFNPIHIDPELAEQVGLGGVILHGLWTMAQVARAHTQAAGGDPRALRSLEVQFRGMGRPEREITVAATVRERGERELRTETWAEQDGERIIRNAEAVLDVG